MHPPLTTFWGKAKIDDTTKALVAWHPLLDHCIDVACVFYALTQIPSIRTRLSRAADQSLTSAHLERLAVLALLHDLGKFNRGFQSKILPEGVRTAGHVRELGPLFGEDALCERLIETLDLPTLCGWFRSEEEFQGMLLAVFSHHGRPIHSDDLQNQDRRYRNARAWWQADAKLDPCKGMQELFTTARQLFPAAFSQAASPIPGTIILQHRFAGLVMLADWIGSHTGFFPYRQDWQEDRIQLARDRAAAVLRTIGFDSRVQQNDLAARAPALTAVFGFTALSPLQQRLSELPIDANSRLLIAEAETGSGKTEAALAWFLRLYAAGAVDGLYFALPTRVAARELYGRVCRYIQQAFPKILLSPVLLAVPGYVKIDGERFLPDSGQLWQDDARERWRERAWAAEHPKRFLAAPVAVGTLDQALLSVLRLKHAQLRSVCLDRQLLVVDEVHASDPYMRYLLKALLRHHLGLGGYAILLSATLGEAARADWLGQAELSLTAAVALPYPSLAHTDGAVEAIGQTSAAGKAVTVEFLPEMEQPEAVIECLVDALRRGARVLVVLNTVSRAMVLQRQVEADPRIEPAWLFHCQDIICPHHGRYARVDREGLDAAVSQRFGKGSPPGPVLLIGTQTLEQSLDIDADLLITDHCPMDVLLQRIGRLQRHRERIRPVGFEAARCVVLALADATLESLLRPDGTVHGIAGLGSVYSDLRVLRLTRETLTAQPQIEIPRDNRWLVEQALHPERLALYDNGPWAGHAQKQDGIILGQEVQAHQALIKPEPFGELRFADFDQNEQIRTRLGLDDRRIALPAAVASPFGRPLEELIIPGHLAPAGDAIEASDIVAAVGEIRFRVGGSAYCYTRLGLERLDESAH